MKNHNGPDCFSAESIKDTSEFCVREIFKKYKLEHKDVEITGDFTDETHGTFKFKENKIVSTIEVEIKKASTHFSVTSPSLNIQKGLRNLLEKIVVDVFKQHK